MILSTIFILWFVFNFEITIINILLSAIGSLLMPIVYIISFFIY